MNIILGEKRLINIIDHQLHDEHVLVDGDSSDLARPTVFERAIPDRWICDLLNVIWGFPLYGVIIYSSLWIIDRVVCAARALALALALVRHQVMRNFKGEQIPSTILRAIE